MRVRTQIVVTTLAAVLAMAPAASAELRAGTAKDPFGDAQTLGIEFKESKDIVQVDARYDTAAGDIVVDATMAGDVPAMGRHYFMDFTIEVGTRGATGCDGEPRVRITGGNSLDWGSWNRSPEVVDPRTRMSRSVGDARVQRSGRHIAFRASSFVLQPVPALQHLDLDCVTVDVRGPGTCILFTGECFPGPLYDRLDAPLSLQASRRATRRVKVKRCPRVSPRGEPLKGARALLAKAGCTVGTVRRPKRAGRRTLVVRSATAADAKRRVDLVLRARGKASTGGTPASR